MCLFCTSVLLLVDDGSAPLIAVQLLWVNMIMDALGALALAIEPPNNELMKRTPVGRKGNFISNVMWRNIVMGQAIYQFLAIWYLQAEGKWLFGIEGDNSDLVLNTIIFNCFVFCQVMWKWFSHSFFCFYQIYRPCWLYFVFLTATIALLC
jgi:magnesium-transporting ATPase (P-type)